jgi:hypothetical protein
MCKIIDCAWHTLRSYLWPSLGSHYERCSHRDSMKDGNHLISNSLPSRESRALSSAADATRQPLPAWLPVRNHPLEGWSHVGRL